MWMWMNSQVQQTYLEYKKMLDSSFLEHPVLALLTMFFTLLLFILVHKMQDDERN